MKLQNKIAIITGGNSGCGKATAKLFAKEGAKLVIAARRAELLYEVAEEIKAAGGAVIAVPADVSIPEQAQKVVDACVEAYGGVDILINSHGVQTPEDITFLDRCIDHTWEYVMDNNARGVFNMMRAVLKVMKDKGGAIASIASLAGVNGGGDAVYVASKGAVIAMTKHVALAYASKHVRCNAICPSAINTPMNDPCARGEGMDMELIGEMAKHSDFSLGTAEPENIAANLLFLVSDDAKNISGQIVVADFGSAL